MRDSAMIGMAGGVGGVDGNVWWMFEWISSGSGCSLKQESARRVRSKHGCSGRSWLKACRTLRDVAWRLRRRCDSGIGPVEAGETWTSSNGLQLGVSCFILRLGKESG